MSRHPSEGGPWEDDFDPDEDDDHEVVGWPDGGDEVLDKPDELLAVHGVSAELFDFLKRWFEVPDAVPLDLREVDAAVAELGDPQMVAALAMRKLQALHLLATPGVRTVTDVVVSIINDLERALIQAPNMWLKRRAAATDWDDAFVALTAEPADGALPVEVEGEPDAVVPDDPTDAEVARFRSLHSQLHEAMFAVLEVCDGEIRELE